MYKISTNAKRKLHRHASKAAKFWDEVCGVIGIKKNNELELLFCHNFAGKAFAFAIKKSDIKEKMKLLKSQGKKFGGIFHSHPIGDITPSKHDIKDSPMNEIMAIYDVSRKELALYNVERKKKKVATLVQEFKTGFRL